jgi:triacylglycerol lipase
MALIMKEQAPLLMALVSEQSYTGFSCFDWSELYEISDEKTCTQLAILTNIDGEVVIAFRGSESRTDWSINLDWKQSFFHESLINPQETIVLNSQRERIRVHRGFYRSYLSVREKIYHYISTHGRTKITLTGHSLGGAIAVLCAYDLAKHLSSEIKVLETYTFGAPRVGNRAFYKELAELVPNSWHYVNGADIVPRLPRWWQGYGQPKLIQLGTRWKFNFLSSRFRDHFIEEYVLELENRK